METNGNLRFGVDLITLYDPSFWGITDFNSFYDNTVLSPDVFWDRALDTLAAAGVEGVEITFGPGHWSNALARYGSAGAFREAVEGRGLTVCSGFYTGLVLERRSAAEPRRDSDVRGGRRVRRVPRGVGLRHHGGRSPDAQELGRRPAIVRRCATMHRDSPTINRMGYETLKRGVRLAIHPETHAVFWLQARPGPLPGIDRPGIRRGSARTPHT